MCHLVRVLVYMNKNLAHARDPEALDQYFFGRKHVFLNKIMVNLNVN